MRCLAEAPIPVAKRESRAAKAEAVGWLVAKQVTLRLVTHVPGIVFGLCPDLVAQAHRSLRFKIASGASIVCTTTVIRVSGLYNRSVHLSGPLANRKISPYFALALKSARTRPDPSRSHSTGGGLAAARWL